MADTDKKPDNKHSGGEHNAPAVNLIRQKIEAAYGGEPNAADEVEEVFAPGEHKLSKHQQFMKQLTTSGKSLAAIQTAWHEYYASLPDKEKHEVWQEFYVEHNKQLDKVNKQNQAATSQELVLPATSGQSTVHEVQAKPQPTGGAKTISEVKGQLLKTAKSQAGVRLKAKQHFQSLLFGVSMGLLVVVILLFGFFNDRFIAPFITPSKNVSGTPIIIDSSTTAVDGTPKVIIPKINVEIPTVYDEPSIEEHAIQNALERGVVHYATTPNPGEKGNAVIFGHSSNNILNRGKYKFAFVLLNRLEIGDTFYITKDKTRYAYRIYEKKIVKPTELGVLGNTDRAATVTLITCDPPGTTLNRLIVIGEQISPDPGGNKESSAKQSEQDKPSIIPSNAPSLWQRIIDFFR